MGIALSPEEAHALVAAYDSDGDGRLSLTDWFHMLAAAEACGAS
jgi:hypothetical protein